MFGISKNVIILGIVSLFNDISSEMICPLLPVFLTQNLGASITFLGFIEGIADTTSSIFKLISGWLSDRFEIKKPIVISGYTFSGISRIGLVLSTTSWHVLFSRFFDRLGKGVRTSPRDNIIASSTEMHNTGKAFSFHRAMDHAGAVIGPILASGLLLYYTDSLYTVFLFASLPGIIAVLLLVIYVKEPAIINKRAGKYRFNIKDFDRPFIHFLLVNLLFTIGNSSNAFLLLKAKETGLSYAALPMLWTTIHIVKMVFTIPCGILSDKIGRKKVILTGWFIYSAIYAGFAFADTPTHIWILFCMYGLFFSFTEGVEKAMVTDLVSENVRGTAFGLYHFSVGIAALPSSIIMGILWDYLGIPSAFLFGSILALISSVLFIFIIKESNNGRIRNNLIR